MNTKRIEGEKNRAPANAPRGTEVQRPRRKKTQTTADHKSKSLRGTSNEKLLAAAHRPLSKAEVSFSADCGPNFS